MSDTKWADVAHYYTPTHGAPDYSVVVGARKTPECMPILRHLDDMTDAEAREIYRLVWGFDIDKSVSMWDAVFEFWSLHGMYHPTVFHWLISHGFDLFGMIERGQAIRKGAKNGL